MRLLLRALRRAGRIPQVPRRRLMRCSGSAGVSAAYIDASALDLGAIFVYDSDLHAAAHAHQLNALAPR